MSTRRYSEIIKSSNELTPGRKAVPSKRHRISEPLTGARQPFGDIANVENQPDTLVEAVGNDASSLFETSVEETCSLKSVATTPSAQSLNFSDSKTTPSSRISSSSEAANATPIRTPTSNLGNVIAEDAKMRMSSPSENKTKLTSNERVSSAQSPRPLNKSKNVRKTPSPSPSTQSTRNSADLTLFLEQNSNALVGFEQLLRELREHKSTQMVEQNDDADVLALKKRITDFTKNLENLTSVFEANSDKIGVAYATPPKNRGIKTPNSRRSNQSQCAVNVSRQRLQNQSESFVTMASPSKNDVTKTPSSRPSIQSDNVCAVPSPGLQNQSKIVVANDDSFKNGVTTTPSLRPQIESEDVVAMETPKKDVTGKSSPRLQNQSEIAVVASSPCLSNPTEVVDAIKTSKNDIAETPTPRPLIQSDSICIVPSPRLQTQPDDVVPMASPRLSIPSENAIAQDNSIENVVTEAPSSRPQSESEDIFAMEIIFDDFDDEPETPSFQPIIQSNDVSAVPSPPPQSANVVGMSSPCSQNPSETIALVPSPHLQAENVIALETSSENIITDKSSQCSQSESVDVVAIEISKDDVTEPPSPRIHSQSENAVIDATTRLSDTSESSVAMSSPKNDVTETPSVCQLTQSEDVVALSSPRPSENIVAMDDSIESVVTKTPSPRPPFEDVAAMKIAKNDVAETPTPRPLIQSDSICIVPSPRLQTQPDDVIPMAIPRLSIPSENAISKDNSIENVVTEAPSSRPQSESEDIFAMEIIFDDFDDEPETLSFQPMILSNDVSAVPSPPPQAASVIASENSSENIVTETQSPLLSVSTENVVAAASASSETTPQPMDNISFAGMLNNSLSVSAMGFDMRASDQSFLTSTKNVETDPKGSELSFREEEEGDDTILNISRGSDMALKEPAESLVSNISFMAHEIRTQVELNDPTSLRTLSELREKVAEMYKLSAINKDLQGQIDAFEDKMEKVQKDAEHWEMMWKDATAKAKQRQPMKTIQDDALAEKVEELTSNLKEEIQLKDKMGEEIVQLRQTLVELMQEQRDSALEYAEHVMKIKEEHEGEIAVTEKIAKVAETKFAVLQKAKEIQHLEFKNFVISLLSRADVTVLQDVVQKIPTLLTNVEIKNFKTKLVADAKKVAEINQAKEAQIDELKSKFKMLQTKHTELEQVSTDSVKMASELAMRETELQATVKKLEEEHADVNAKFEDAARKIKTVTSEKEQLQSELTDVVEKYETNLKSLTASEAELAKKESNLKAYKEAQAELNTKNMQRIHELEELLANSDVRIQQARESAINENNDALSNELAQLKLYCRQKDAELDEVQIAFLLKEATVAELQREVQSLRQEVVALESNQLETTVFIPPGAPVADQIQNAIAETLGPLRAELAAKSDQLLVLQTELTVANSKISRGTSILDDLRAERKYLRDQLMVRPPSNDVGVNTEVEVPVESFEVKGLKDRVAALSNTIETLTDELETHDEIIQKYNEELYNCRATIKALQLRLGDIKEENFLLPRET